MKVIKAISGALLFVERAVVVLLLGAMVAFAFLQVILRNVFATGLLWVDPFLRHLVLWIGFLGASIATQQEKHINIDLVTRFLSPRATNVARVFTNLFAGSICALLSNAGWTFVASERSTGGSLFTIGNMEFASWWFQIIIPVGFGLMSLRFLIRTAEHIIEAFNPTPTVRHTTNVPTLDD
jgi:TRAP-type C4-dicarboxylate transport system permease small subunit